MKFWKSEKEKREHDPLNQFSKSEKQEDYKHLYDKVVAQLDQVDADMRAMHGVMNDFKRQLDAYHVLFTESAVLHQEAKRMLRQSEAVEHVDAWLQERLNK